MIRKSTSWLSYALVEPGSIDLAAAAQSAGLDNSMPVVFGVGGLSSESGEVQALLRKAGFCAVSTPTAAENAIRALVEDARARVVPAPLAVASSDASGTDGPFDEAQAKNFLADLEYKCREIACAPTIERCARLSRISVARLSSKCSTRVCITRRSWAPYASVSGQQPIWVEHWRRWTRSGRTVTSSKKWWRTAWIWWSALDGTRCSDRS